MSGPPLVGAPQGRRTYSVRALLLAVAVALVFFIGITAVSVVRLLPRAGALDRSAASLSLVTRSINWLDSAVTQSAQALDTLAASVNASGRVPTADETDELRAQLRRLEKDSWTSVVERARIPLPDAAQIHLARAFAAEDLALQYLAEAEASLMIGDAASATASLAAVRAYQRDAHRHLDELASTILADLAARESRFVRGAERAVAFTIWWGLVGFALLAAVVTVMYQRVYRRLAHLEEGFAEIAAGNLQHRLRVRWNDEIGRLQSLFNAMADQLRGRATSDARHAQNLAQRLTRVLDESSNEFYIFDAATLRIVATNRGARRNLGYTERQLHDMTPLDLLDGFTRERLTAVLDTVRSGVQPKAFLNAVHRRADGTTYPVELMIQFSGAEEPPVFHVAAQDISERTRIEAERDLMFEQSADLMGIGNVTTGRLTRVNPAWARTMGLPAHEITARPLADFIHPDDRAVARRHLEELVAGVPVRNTAIRLRDGDGAYRWISWNIEPPQGGVIYAIGRDVTERRRAETRQAELQAAVARSAREWRLTFDALDDPIVIVNQAGEVVRANSATARLAGQSHPDLLGRPLETLEPGPLWSRAAELAASVREDGQPASDQLRYRTGQTWDVEVHPVARADAGKMTAIVVAHDVTSVVRLQDAARRNEAMAAMGALVAGVAHEVRNPLFSMTATLDAFEARQQRDAAGERHIRVLRTQLDRLQQLMRELLEYGKPPQLSLACTDLDQVARQAVEESAHLARERGVAVVCDLPGGLPAIRADRARLAQVYVNLLTNAIHHSPDASTVLVRGRLQRENGSTWVETTVEDAGRGFPPEDLGRIFEPFFTRRPGGTGLGLALVQRIVEQHGGVVRAANRSEGGAVLTVRLPVAGN